MPLADEEVLRCEQCGAPLASVVTPETISGCLNCLLLGGVNEAESINRCFQHYEVSVLSDGVTAWELGRGAMGATYHAVDTNLGSPVALKIIGSRYSADPVARERFRREAQAAAQLRHPNVATVFHFGETKAGQCFYAMELVEGETLEARVHRDGALPILIALGVAEQIARALAAAEKHGLVHRDLKPTNIMVVANDPDTADGLTVKVIDFGLAKPVVTTKGISDRFASAKFSGTPGFASPEQLTADSISSDVRSDIYSLGATLWYLLSGNPPFASRTPGELREEQLQRLPMEQLTATKVPAPLATLLCSMLATDPANRPQSAKELLVELRRCREAIEARPRRRRLMRLAALLLLTVSGIGLTSYFWHHQPVRERTPSAATIAPWKSIAVLPFENLSNDNEDAFFADGVQDDILTKLAKVRDLKVISRTSVMQYRGKLNMRDIGAALGASHVLQGSVRKSGTQVHMNAQLIDTRTDTHVWAEQYDCDLNGIFAAQSAIALKVADQFHAKLSSAEKLDLARPPTADLTAFGFYTQAKNLVLMTSFSGGTKANLLQAADLLNRAIAHDSSFFQAYCLLSHTHDLLYFFGFERSPERLALAESAIQAASRLRPDSGEAHLARAENLYRGYLDYDGALTELELARESLPNDPMVFELKGYIERRRGKQQEALQSLERAVDLDPRNFFTLQQIAASYDLLQRYADEASMLERALAIKPGDLDTKIARALMEVDWKADTRPLHGLIDEIRATNPADLENVADAWLVCALAERDATAAKAALNASGENPLSDDVIQFNRPFAEGVVARMTNDPDKARLAFTAARAAQEKTVQAQPDYGPLLCVLGLIDAALGRREDALHEGRRAVELLSVEKDAINGPRMIVHLAMIAAWVGEKDLACEQLAMATHPPAPVTYGQLKLLPFWDPLRGDPRFEKIVESLAPR
ncbi:MAG TPA: protein kinase [Candidatus Udaeobacter sp.]|jgi:serine/threonine-protein kinase